MMMSQISGTFSSQGNLQITTNGVSFKDDSDGIVKELGFIFLNRYEKVPQNLIDEANLIYTKTGIIQCIYDLSDKIELSKYQSKDECRDLKLDLLLDDKFYINSWYELQEMPSRMTFYDTATNQTDLFERHKKVLEYMNFIGFNISNLLDNGLTDQELLWDSYSRETSYCSKFVQGIIIRVKSNLMVEVIVIRNGLNKNYFFFYNPNQILSIVSENSDTEYKRELKIKTILS